MSPLDLALRGALRRDIPADDQSDNIIVGDILDRALAMQLTVSKNDKLVAKLEHLVEKMRDVDNRLPLALEAAHDFEQGLLFLETERGRGFIEDYDFRAHRQRAGDFDDLPLADRERAHL